MEDMGGILLGLGDSSTLHYIFCIVLTLALERKDAVVCQRRIGVRQNTERVQSHRWLNCIFSVDFYY